MFKLLIESIVDDALTYSEDVGFLKVKEENENDFLERMLPEESILREMYEIGKEYHMKNKDNNLNNREDKGTSEYIERMKKRDYLLIETVIDDAIFKLGE